MINTHCNMIQEGDAALFYKYDKSLKGYMIAGLLVAPTTFGKISFAKLWKYFVSEIVTSDDIYCSIIVEGEHELFNKYTIYHSEHNGVKVYKVDNFLKDKYSNFARHLENRNSGR